MNGLTVVALIFLVIAVVVALLFILNIGGSFFGTGKKIKVVVGSAEFLADVVDNALSRAQGLSGRDGLGKNEGMLFIFGSPSSLEFWMKDMKFPIDIIWIKTDSPPEVLPGKTSGGKVVGFSENAEPEPGKMLWELKKYLSPELADVVLEVNAGVVAELGIKIGDAVSY